MPLRQFDETWASRASISLHIQPINTIMTSTITQGAAMEKLRRTVDMNVFQELLDLDTPEDIFSREVVSEFLVLAPETLFAMEENVHQQDLSQLGFNAQSLRCAAMVLGLTRIEKACARIETILALGIDLSYTGIGLNQICDILGFVIKDARAHFISAQAALTSCYGLPLTASEGSDASDEL